MSTVLVIPGSSRAGGNGVGLSKWLTAQLSTHFPPNTAFKLINLPLPLGQLTDIPAGRDKLSDDPSKYPNKEIFEWSKTVRSSAGVVILTPQYNWGYPGDVKNVFDYLYWEWRDKPVMIITYGGHGGAKCGEQLRQVLEGGVKVKLCPQNVEISLPEEYIRGGHKIQHDLEKQRVDDQFLQKYEEPVKKLANNFWDLVQEYQKNQGV